MLTAHPLVSPLLLFVAILIGLVVALETGLRLGRRAVANRKAPGGVQVGSIQGATLGMLGLLLAFCFAGAAGRFMERQDLIIDEANAIGTAYLRADLLPLPQRNELQSTLREYVERRLVASRSLHRGLSAEFAAEFAGHHERMWKAARDGVREKPEFAKVVLDPVNEVIDLHSWRIAAGRKHLPALVLTLLLVCSALAMSVIGYGCGLSGRRSLALTGAVPFLIGAALWTTIDLDYPRVGLIRLSDEPLKSLQFRAAP